MSKVAAIKTVPTDASVEEFLGTVTDERRREDSFELLELMREVTGEQGRMWGDAIVGFGDFLLTYASGRVVRWPGVGFSPRKGSLTLYLSMDLQLDDGLLDNLGPHTTGVGCLYLKRLQDVNLDELRRIVAISMASTRKMAANAEPTEA